MMSVTRKVPIMMLRRMRLWWSLQVVLDSNETVDGFLQEHGERQV